MDKVEQFKLTQLTAIQNESGIGVTANGLSISFDPNAPDDGIRKFIATLADWMDRISKLRSVGKLWMAKAVLEIAARTEQTPEEAIDSLEIPPIHGWSPKTLMRYVGAVQRLGEDAFINNLTDGQVLLVAQYRGPEDVDKSMEFAERRRAIMADAVSSGMDGKILASKMKELQAEFNVMPKGGRNKEDKSSIYMRMMYIHKNADDEWYIANGVEKSSLNAWIYSYELELAESMLLPYTLDEIDIPYMLKPENQPTEGSKF